MIKSSLKYAALCSVFLIVIYHISNYFGLNPLINIGHLIFDIIIFGLFIFFAEKEYKSYMNDGILHFWQGMTIGFSIYTISTVIFCIGLAFYFFLIEEAVRNYQEAATNFLNSKADIYKEEFGDDGFQLQLDEINKVTGWYLVWSSGVKKLFAGFFITPVISIILRKQPK